MRWLITGGCGFIGVNLARAVLAIPGTRIRIFDNMSVGKPASLAHLLAQPDGPARIDIEQGDILDPGHLAQVCRDCDIVVHLAANTGVPLSLENPHADCMANIVGTFNLLEASRHAGIRRFVFASSGAPLGNCALPISEDSIPRPTSPYGASKLAGEGYCSAYWQSFGLDTVALRFSNVYGPHSAHKQSIVAKFITAAQNGQPWQIYGDGQQTRDFIYVDDLVSAIIHAAHKPDIGGELFQIATNTETGIGHLATVLAHHIEQAGIAVAAPRFATPRTGDVLRNYADISKAARLLDWRPQTALDDGLRRTVDWFVARQDGQTP